MSWREIVNPQSEKYLQQLGPDHIDRVWQRWQDISAECQLQRRETYRLGHHSSTQLVDSPDGPAVLKIFITPGTFSQQYSALRRAASSTVPKIHRAWPEKEALLLEHIAGEPGEQWNFTITEQVVRTVNIFHQRSALPETRLVAAQMKIAERYNHSPVAQRALKYSQYFQQLEKLRRPGMVHGDLLPGNIILSRRSSAPVTLIDLRGYRGSQIFDWATLALYSSPAGQLKNYLQQVAELSAAPLSELAAWAWLRTMISSAIAEQRNLPQSIADLAPHIVQLEELIEFNN